MAWTLSDMRTKFRSLTRRTASGDIADSVINTYLNDYMRYDFPVAVDLDRLDTAWSQALTATDDGEYTVSTDVIEITEPVMLNGTEELTAFHDQEEFWRIYPADEGYITAPTLVVGSVSAAKVGYSAFVYSISGYQYSVSASEVALSGDAVPQSKYGAWMLSIDADGDITITAASDNATGYATPGKAVEGIATADITDAVMGYVTAICSSGVFTPGTTELNTGANVTATFTDGHPDLRGRPESVLLTCNSGKIVVRPKPNDQFLIASRAVLQRPTALSADSDTPSDEAWGLAICLGAAIKFLAAKEGDSERILELQNGVGMQATPGCLRYELASIRRGQLLQQKPEIERYW